MKPSGRGHPRHRDGLQAFRSGDLDGCVDDAVDVQLGSRPAAARRTPAPEDVQGRGSFTGSSAGASDMAAISHTEVLVLSVYDAYSLCMTYTVEVERARQVLRPHPRARGVDLRIEQGHRLRPARAQRRRQDHPGPDPGDPGPGRRGQRAGRRPRPGHQGREIRRVIGLTGQYAAVDDVLTGAENLRDGGPPPQAVEPGRATTYRRAAHRVRPGRRGRASRSHLLGWHASAGSTWPCR